MMDTSRLKRRLPELLFRKIGIMVLAVGVLACAAAVLLHSQESRATAIFPSTHDLYAGDDVRILGVKVGSVDSVTPQPDGVRVAFHYNSKYKVPANVQAAVVAPALVSNRYMELSPAYTGGLQLDDDATIPRDRTAVPVEFDQVKSELNNLTTALGPQGVNKNGALGNLLNTASEYKGQGQLFHDTMEQLSNAMRTISTGRNDLFGTVRNLAVFTSALAASDNQITQFTHRLDSVSGVLADNRTELANALAELDAATPEVTRFLSENRGAVTQATGQSAEVMRLLSSQRAALEDVLHVLPNALDNVYNIYDPLTGSYTGQLQVPNMMNPGQFICSAIGAAAHSASPADAEKLCSTTVGPLLQLLQMQYAPVSANPLDRQGSPSTPGNTFPTAPSPGGQTPKPAPNVPQLLNPAGGR